MRNLKSLFGNRTRIGSPVEPHQHVTQSRDLTDVTVRFSPVVAKAATAASVARDRRVERGDDGSVDITYRVADPLEIVRWSLSWGTEGEVIAPPSAREHARALARALAATYER